MTEEKRRDQQLAAFTDALLEHQLRESERPPLADIVEVLTRALCPQPLPDHLRLKVRRRIAAEWDRQSSPLSQRILKLFRQPSRRWVWMAAAASLLIVAAVALLIPMGPVELTGTAVGDAGVIASAILLVLVGVLVVARLARRR